MYGGALIGPNASAVMKKSTASKTMAISPGAAGTIHVYYNCSITACTIPKIRQIHQEIHIKL